MAVSMVDMDLVSDMPVVMDMVPELPTILLVTAILTSQFKVSVDTMARERLSQ